MGTSDVLKVLKIARAFRRVLFENFQNGRHATLHTKRFTGLQSADMFYLNAQANQGWHFGNNHSTVVQKIFEHELENLSQCH